jgi:hypothetical protein
MPVWNDANVGGEEFKETSRRPFAGTRNHGRQAVDAAAGELARWNGTMLWVI